ncbi:MAG: zinc ribbon domain-containing protein [Methyloversatilis sp.]|uniref:FmdB family zinc ribbon protein n=1 Tax=Methyloversatilis sp. TaxID=2569862 RepID=UPI002732D695|nr:FmdB family zinc ribbon protein [Methyloversatilis sp.]MDP2868491.1 zinc ribbon domain-containing protein [Methyloversatilis sp.]MDP3579511.1 zinc ribbon domain-containing protein [Methyloversatilis sp.]
MPIYGYRCSSCGHEKDVMQKISEAKLTVCPACGASTFTKQLSAAGFQLKGSGWYATDFKGGGAKPASPAAGADAAKEASSGSSAEPASTDSSPAAPKACGGPCACH